MEYVKSLGRAFVGAGFHLRPETTRTTEGVFTP